MLKLKNVFRAFKMTWQCDKKYVLIKGSMIILNSFFTFVSIYLAKMLMDILVSGEFVLATAAIFILSKLIIDIILLIMNMLQSKYYPIIEVKLSYQMQEQLIKTAAHVDYSSFDEPRFYDSMEFALREANGLTKSIESFLSIFSAIINFIVALVLCLQYDWLLPMILVLGIFPYYFMRNKLDKYAYDVSVEINALGRKTSALRHLLISKYYAHEVRSFNLFDFLISKYRSFVAERIRLTRKSTAKKNNYSFVSSLCNLLVGLIATFRIVFLLSIKVITLGEYTLLQSYVVKMQSSLYSAIDFVLKIKDHNVYLENLFIFVDEAQRMKKAKGTRSLTESNAHKIEFRNVSFCYPNHENEVLKNINFLIAPGETVLLIGENGAGKSTLLSLLNAFYDNYTGEILVDDVNIKELDPESLRYNISMMFQGGTLLPLTLRDNVFCGQDMEENFSDFPWFQSLVKKYPNGLDTHVLTYMYPDGIEPSGGEIQRIKLMRAIAKKGSGIIVMDEPTSAIDPETEHQILASIKIIGKEKTSIIVSHNLSCATYVDKVIHLKNGEIIEIGSHHELMEKNGEYARLFKLQAEKYSAETNKKSEVDENEW